MLNFATLRKSGLGEGYHPLVGFRTELRAQDASPGETRLSRLTTSAELPAVPGKNVYRPGFVILSLPQTFAAGIASMNGRLCP